MNKKDILTGIAIAGVAMGVGAYTRRNQRPSLTVAPKVNLKRYLGEWYEIARLPASFEKNCYGTKARYTLRKDGAIDVLNTCYKGSLDGKMVKAKGKAFVADKKTNAKLKVQFFWPFKGDYWILEVGTWYDYAIVGTPDRKNLWILSRRPRMRDRLLKELIAKAEAQGFDTSQLIFTEQPG